MKKTSERIAIFTLGMVAGVIATIAGLWYWLVFNSAGIR